MSVQYWLGAGVSIVRNVVADIMRSDTHRFDYCRTLARSGLVYEQRPRLESKHFLDLFPTAETLVVPMGDVRFRRSNANPYEAFCLSAIAVLMHPARIFEIGTFDGATTLRFARAAPTAEILTLDLPPDPAIPIAS